MNIPTPSTHGQKSATSPNTFPCHPCGKQFNSQPALQMHKNTAKAHRGGFASTSTHNPLPHNGPRNPVTVTGLLPSTSSKGPNRNISGSRCTLCDKYFPSKHALRAHKRDSPKHQTHQASNPIIHGPAPAPAPAPDSLQGGGVKLPMSPTGSSPDSQSSNSCFSGTRSSCGDEATTSRKPVPSGLISVADSQKGLVTDSGRIAASALSTSIESGSAMVSPQVNQGDMDGVTEVKDGWSSIPVAEQDGLLNALQDQCHSLDCLSKEGYWIEPPTPLDLDQKKKCDNCRATKRKLDDTSMFQCHFHPARGPFTRGILRGRDGGSQNAACFNCQTKNKGCMTLPWHTFITVDKKLPEMKASPESNPRARKAVVLDCEMVGVLGTNNHVVNEVVSLSAVDFLTGEILINTYVDPQKRVISWRTKFSGVSASFLEKMKSQRRVLPGWKAARASLWSFIDEETILIGHSLNNDLDVLGMVHTRVVDSALLTRDAVGKECNRFWGLKKLVKLFLERDIQTGSSGHDCLEDTFGAREVVLWCLRYPDQLQEWAASERDTIVEQARQRKEKERQKAILIEGSSGGSTGGVEV
ncbi:hypothetical protein BJX70DRAFT_406338 [Aspergillus crustosus]